MSDYENFPKEWRLLNLGKIAAIIDPHPSHRAPEEVAEGVAFAGIGDLTENGELIPGKARIVPLNVLDEHEARYELSGNSIGFGRVASIGKVIKFPLIVSDLTISPTMAIIEPHSINRDFLLHSLRGEHVGKVIDKWLTGSTRSSLGIELLRRLPVPVPDPESQKQIGTILSSVESAIEKTESLITKYQQIKAGLMHDLFSRGVTADSKLRPPREEAPELYKEMSVGWIPKEWDVVMLDHLCSIIDPQPDHRTPPEQDDGIPYIGIGDFDAFGDVDTSSCRRVVVSTYLCQKDRFSVEAGDIIYGKIGTIGQPRKLPGSEYALSANVLLMKPSINRQYFLHALMTRYFAKQISDITNTTSQPALGIEKVRKLQLPSPSPNEQVLIAQYLDQLDSKLIKEFSAAQKLRKQKTGLMFDLLTGKVSVKVELESVEMVCG